LIPELMQSKIIIGTRGSDLALWQANFIKNALLGLGLFPQIKIIKTQGDQIQHLNFDKMEGKGFFTKELEEALLNGTIDLAVHSFKDLPTTSPAGLVIAALSAREDPSELLLIHKDALDFRKKFNLKEKGLVGTSSPRRKSQMYSFRQDIEIKDLRGNVPTRIQKLRDKQYDAILLAKAGTDRLQLDLSEFHCEIIDPTYFIPAPAQGVLALQINENNQDLFALLQASLHDKEVAAAVGIERKVLNLLEGGCQLPLGVYCTKKEKDYLVWVSKASSWDKIPLRLFFNASSPDHLPQRIVSKIKELKPLSIFITRELKADSDFLRILNAHEYQVFGQSLISFKTIPFVEIPKTNWVFFSSTQAVIHFFEQQPEIVPSAKFGVIGKGTEMTLKQYGHRADFIGGQADIIETGLRFAHLTNGQSILFPKAKNSLRSIQKQLGENTHLIDLDVYESIALKNTPVPETDLLIFTSPSNVDAFMEGNKVKGQKVFAIGKSTGQKLASYGVMDYNVPHTPDEISLIEAIFSL
jgi:hydroxymethylbilane synthase